MHFKLKLSAAILFLAGFMSLPAITPYLPFFGPANKDIVTDWASRVVANGGDMPSQSTIQCMETLRLALIAQGITNKIYSLCIFVPDSVIAATTPLFKHLGSDPWTNGNFVIGDLNINGLKGDASTKFLDTAIKANNTQMAAASGGARGLTVVISESSSNNAGGLISYADAGLSLRVSLGIGTDTDLEFFPTSSNPMFFAETNDIARVGWISANQVVDGGATNVDIYVASPLETHKLLKRLVIPAGVPQNTATDGTIAVFTTRRGLTNSLYIAQRLSVAMLHNGFTQNEASNAWTAVKACRECLGGGTGDPVHDWANKIIVAGGSAISTTTSNAARTFWQGLDTDSLLYKMVAVNIYPSDSLTAARTPLVWKAGLEFWTNTAFGSSNLTVNGLTGNTSTKFLGTGLRPADLNYGGFSDSSAGESIMIYSATNTGAGSLMEYGGQGTAANSYFGLQLFAARFSYYCWSTATINTTWLAGPPLTSFGGSNYSGFISGNRPAANAIAIYLTTNGVFNVYTNATGNNAGNNNTITNSFAHATADAVGVVGTFSDRTVSFLAVHSGLTQTESSNLWVRVKNVRTSLGGGNP